MSYKIKRVATSILMIATLSVVVFCFSCTSKPKAEEQQVNENNIPPMPVSELPNLTMTKTDGARLSSKSLQGGKVIFVLFQPDCEHCQREAKEVKNHLDAFKNYSLYFLSSDSLKNLEKFGQDYNLSKEPNIYFAATDVQSIIDNFGFIPTPSFYIYNEQGKLVTKFNGETDINLITKAL